MDNVVSISELFFNDESLSSPLASSTPASIEPLYGSLSRCLRKLQMDMFREDCPADQKLFRDVRPFRQRFCFLVRKFGDFTLEELCERLNEHPDILRLAPYPSFNDFYPITPEFLSDLETDISRIQEYRFNGFPFGGFGVPTDDVARAIADICGAHEELQQFIGWCIEYRFGKEIFW